MSKEQEALYRAALAADEAFQRELVRVYGQGRAGDARYLAQHSDVRVSQAYQTKREADDAWFQAWKEV